MVLINELISDNNIDLFCLTETWLRQDEYVSLNESTPPSHINTHIPRDTGRGGGVAAILNSAPLINSKPRQIFRSFENPIPTLLFIVLSNLTLNFYLNFQFLSALVLKIDKVIIVGYFNIHIDIENYSLGTALLSLLD